MCILHSVWPMDPQIYVMYHDAGGVVYDNSILYANCSAFVGTFGYMSWWVRNVWPPLEWVIDTDAKLVIAPNFHEIENTFLMNVKTSRGNGSAFPVEEDLIIIRSHELSFRAY